MFARGWIRIVVVMVLFLGAMPAHGADSLESAVTRLSTVKVFAFGGVGYAGTTSEGEVYFRAIAYLERQVALRAFETVYEHGNAEARLYALSGIRWLDPLRFKELLKVATSSSAMVNMESGCILTTESYSKLALRIHQGDFEMWVKRDFESPGKEH